MRGRNCIWLFVGLAWAWPGVVWAGAVDGLLLISQQHHVWGYAGSDTYWEPGGTEVDYDQASSEPLEVWVTGSYIDDFSSESFLTAGSRAGGFGVEAHGEYWFSQANAMSAYTFTAQPGVRSVTVSVRSSGSGVGYFDETNVWFRFDDLTAGMQMAAFTAPSGADWDDQPDIWTHTLDGVYPIDALHTYAMTLFAQAGTGDTFRDAWLDVTVRPAVPAPGAAILAVIGAGLVGRLRQRRVL